MTRDAGELEYVEIVILCTANQARSPLAAALLRRRVEGLPVRVRSRGVVAEESAPALQEMISAARELGVDLRSHRASGLVKRELEDVDLVIGFEPAHIAAAVIDGGADRDTAFTLPELAGLLDTTAVHGEGNPRARLAAGLARVNDRRRTRDPFRAPAIDDPVGGSQQTFARVAREIEAMVVRLASGLLVGAPAPARSDHATRSPWGRVLGATVRRRGDSSSRRGE